MPLYKGKWNIQPDSEFFKETARRWGYTPIGEVIGELIGLSAREVVHKINHSGFKDGEKIVIAKEFELTAQEFVDMFFPGRFRPDGTIILDREVKYHGIKEKRFDVYPWRSYK